MTSVTATILEAAIGTDSGLAAADGDHGVPTLRARLDGNRLWWRGVGCSLIFGFHDVYDTTFASPMEPVRLGAHLSLGRSPSISLQEARAHGAQSAQIFASSPSAWKPPVFEANRYAEIRDVAASIGIEPVVIHAIYLINLASPDPILRARSRTSLVATLEAAEALRVTLVTTHIGSHGGRGFADVAPMVAEGLVDVLEQTPTAPVLALENSAGAGNIIGSTLEELAELIDLAGQPDRLQVTLDTAHLCGAGWDFTDANAARGLVNNIHESFGFDRLALVHANDSRVACGTRRDRHEVVGEGHIGEAGFRLLLAQPALRSVPWILETPDLGDEDVGEKFRSLRRLARLDAEVSGRELPAQDGYDADTQQTPGV